MSNLRGASSCSTVLCGQAASRWGLVPASWEAGQPGSQGQQQPGATPTAARNRACLCFPQGPPPPTPHPHPSPPPTPYPPTHTHTPTHTHPHTPEPSLLPALPAQTRSFTRLPTAASRTRPWTSQRRMQVGEGSAGRAAPAHSTALLPLTNHLRSCVVRHSDQRSCARAPPLHPGPPCPHPTSTPPPHSTPPHFDTPTSSDPRPTHPRADGMRAQKQQKASFYWDKSGKKYVKLHVRGPAAPRCAVLRCAVPCCAVPCRALPCCAVLCGSVLLARMGSPRGGAGLCEVRREDPLLPAAPQGCCAFLPGPPAAAAGREDQSRQARAHRVGSKGGCWCRAAAAERECSPSLGAQVGRGAVLGWGGWAPAAKRPSGLCEPGFENACCLLQGRAVA